MADFSVTSEQFEDDPPVVVLPLDRALPEWDGFNLSLSPARAEELATALTRKAADARASRIDITYTEDEL